MHGPVHFRPPEKRAWADPRQLRLGLGQAQNNALGAHIQQLKLSLYKKAG